MRCWYESRDESWCFVGSRDMGYGRGSMTGVSVDRTGKHAMERTALIYRPKYKMMQLSTELIVHAKNCRRKACEKTRRTRIGTREPAPRQDIKLSKKPSEPENQGNDLMNNNAIRDIKKSEGRVVA